MTSVHKAVAAAIFIVGILLGAAAGNFYGRAEGRQLERGEKAQDTVKDLTGLIDSQKTLIGQAAAASKQMRGALAARAAQDSKSSQELKDALSSTADSRAGCVFPSGVMRQLATARDRAAEAAAGGVGGTVPGAASGATVDR